MSRRVFFVWRDVTLLPHPPEDDVAPLERSLRVRPGRQRRGSADEAREVGGLREAQAPGGLAEDRAGHRLGTVSAGAHVDAVEVQLEDLILAEPLLHEERQRGFLGLA